MGEVVYLLCALTSLLCAVLLLRAYRQRRMRLLLWSGLCFVGLTLNNGVLFIDKVLVPEVDLSLWDDATALIAVSLLVFGLIWEGE
jgi:cytochrome bd-type quinol oxidase subunit 2